MQGTLLLTVTWTCESNKYMEMGGEERDRYLFIVAN
jgi:hypothetical protein